MDIKECLSVRKNDINKWPKKTIALINDVLTNRRQRVYVGDRWKMVNNGLPCHSTLFKFYVHRLSSTTNFKLRHDIALAYRSEDAEIGGKRQPAA